MGSKKILYAGIAILVLGIGFAIGTYAYYQNTVTGSITGTVLYWDCTQNVSSATTVLNNLYPGKGGTITFNLTCSMEADYSIFITGQTNMGPGNTTHPNLNLYKNASTTVSSNIITSSSSSAVATGTLSAGTAKTVTLYYNWPYGTVEEYKTGNPSFTYSIIFKQKQ